MQVKFENKARKEFLKLDREIQIQILRYIEKIKVLEDPRDMGKSLAGDLKDYWRYCVGNYRLICKIKDDELLIIIIHIGHRNKIYKFFKG